ncbi:MAG TPA: hypothetical protein VH681_00720 [Nitrospiraceae bacterium]|jgi:hypothetical protein
MRIPHQFFLIVTALLMCVPSALAEAPVNVDPAKMWECPQADGTALYTNKELPGCKLMSLKELSVVPSLDNMPTYVSPYPPSASRYDGVPTTGAAVTVPDWARDWRATVASTGSVYAEVCSMYGEWLSLNQKTRGGFFFGSDPSYGGDLSGRNMRGPSYSFYDNTRYRALASIFGAGFVPVGCQ